ncbi:MAG TPA: hypothetical protein VHL11_23155, partial [Phototrophicaceae bacterium]|nr:hypothetical protein [Phototrophicaceae bacterium]
MVIVHLLRQKRQFLLLTVLIVLIIPAVQPLLRGQLPWTADGTLHLYRLVALDHALADGTLWARYAPGMAYGYGAPFFNYYSPLSLYPMLILHKIGLSFLSAWLWGMVLYTLVAAVGAYSIGQIWGNLSGAGDRDRGVIAGMVTAAAYIYAPYSLYDALWRGTVSEYAALALLPYVLWALTRLGRYGRRIDWLLTVIAFGLFIPMHNVITLHGAALIGIYAMFVWWFVHPAGEQSQGRLLRGIMIFSPLVVALLLTAFFWLPALTETSYVKLDAITQSLSEIDVTRNLTDLSSIFALPIPADPTRMQPPLPIALSWSQITLAGLAVGLVFLRTKTGRPLQSFVVLSVILIVGLVFMNTRASAVIWETVPLIRYSQFPWRLLGLASLLLALLAGIGVMLLLERIQSQAGKIAAITVALSAVIIYGYFYLYPLYLPDVNPTSIVDAQNFERESGLVATSSFGEYLPIWNFEAPDATRLVERYARSAIISRLEMPEDVLIERQSWGNTATLLVLNAPKESVLTFDWFYFPGWQAKLDGQPVELTPSPGVGLIQVTMPTGRHELEIWLGNTDRQILAWRISAAGFVLMLVGILRIRRVAPLKSSAVISDSHWLLTVGVIGLMLIGVKSLLIDPGKTPLQEERFANGLEAGVQYLLDANFANTITLLGYDLSLNQIASS